MNPVCYDVMKLVSSFGVLKVQSNVGTAVQEAPWRFVFYDVRVRRSCNPQVWCFPAISSIRLTSGIVVPVSSALLTLTPTLMRPLHIVTCLLSMATTRRSRRKYVLTMVSGTYTRIRLAKIASSFFLLRCVVSSFYSTGITTYVYCHFACFFNMLDPDHLFLLQVHRQAPV